MATAASRASGASGLVGSPEPPPVRGSWDGAVPTDRAWRAGNAALRVAVLPKLPPKYVPPPPVFGLTVGTGTGGGGVGVGGLGPGPVGAVVGVAVGVAVFLGFGFGVGVGVGWGGGVGVGGTAVAVGGTGVAVSVGGAGGGAGGVLAAAKLRDVGECMAVATASMPIVMGNAKPSWKRLFIQDSSLLRFSTIYNVQREEL